MRSHAQRAAQLKATMASARKRRRLTPQGVVDSMHREPKPKGGPPTIQGRVGHGIKQSTRDLLRRDPYEFDLLRRSDGGQTGGREQGRQTHDKLSSNRRIRVRNISRV
jgi:hypothetical protein